MQMVRVLLRGVSLSIALLLAPTLCGAQGVSVSPRISLMDASGSRNSMISTMAGVRVELVREGLRPFGGLFRRGREVSYIHEKPPQDGAQFVVGVSGRYQRDGIRPYASLGGGIVLWRNPDWGDPIMGEIEGGFELDFSSAWGVMLAGRLEKMDDVPVLLGGTLGLMFRFGR